MEMETSPCPGETNSTTIAALLPVKVRDVPGARFLLSIFSKIAALQILSTRDIQRLQSGHERSDETCAICLVDFGKSLQNRCLMTDYPFV